MKLVPHVVLIVGEYHAGHGSKPTPGCLPSSLQERLPYESTIVASVSGSFQFHYECVRTTPHVAKRGTETRGDFRKNGDSLLRSGREG